MDIIIPATTGLSTPVIVTPLLVGMVIAAVLACVYIEKWNYTPDGSSSSKKYGTLIIVFLILSFGAMGSALGVAIFKYNVNSEAVTSAFYEKHDIADFKDEDGRSLDLGKVACVGDAPPAEDRPSEEVTWTDADGFRRAGTLANMGNIDGECRITLQEQPPLD